MENSHIDAFTCDPYNSPVPIPASVERLIQKSPSWLADQLQLVVGTMTQEVVQRRIVKDEAWQVLRQRPRLHNDPALVIGPFVLTGWGPSDLDENEAHSVGQFARKSPLLPMQNKFKVLPFVKKLLGGS